jgi:hypothetical protein
MGAKRGKLNADRRFFPRHLSWPHLHRQGLQGSPLLLPTRLKNSNTRGGWRSALLLVAAAEQPEEEWQGEGQQQQHDEELQGREPLLYVAAVGLNNAVIRSGSIALPRRL